MEKIDGDAADLFKGKRINWMQTIISLVLLVASSLLLYSSLSTYIKDISALQYKRTDAKVVKIIEHFDAFSIRKEVQMRYWINGVEKSGNADIPPGRVMKPGELTLLFYDPNNTENVVLSQDVDYDLVIPGGAFGLFGLCFALFFGYKALRA